ncbi:metal ABC transporter substrate-binding protein [Georgenia sp. Z1491]|uniref:metal ABC transporter substrate-binding protein n=1 Tax=Georgenia sp. Z1491 TaxID=3416707 RepID=UPI003CF8CB3E
MLRPSRVVLASAAAALVLAGCSGADPDDDAAVEVGTAAYAFEWLVEQVGGERVAVTNVTPPGADAHSLELAPAQVVDLEQADLVVHLPQYQAAMDDAVGQLGEGAVLDAAGPTEPLAPEELAEQGGDDAHDHDDEDEGHDHSHADAADDHAADDHSHDAEGHDHSDHGAADDHAGHDHGALDPHVWLDPERMIALAETVADRLTEIDPDGADAYADGLDAVVADLEDLREQIADRLGSCSVETVVVGHQAYGYLLAPHGFVETGLAGIDGGTEVSPARIAELSALVEESGATAIYRDANAPDDAVRAVAEQTGADVQVLDPLEIAPADGDYRDAMQANIDALATGQQCG